MRHWWRWGAVRSWAAAMRPGLTRRLDAGAGLAGGRHAAARQRHGAAVGRVTTSRVSAAGCGAGFTCTSVWVGSEVGEAIVAANAWRAVIHVLAWDGRSTQSSETSQGLQRLTIVRMRHRNTPGDVGTRCATPLDPKHTIVAATVRKLSKLSGSWDHVTRRWAMKSESAGRLTSALKALARASILRRYCCFVATS